MSGYGTFIVTGLASDDWPGADKPGRKWGLASRVAVDGDLWTVVGVIVDPLGDDLVNLRRYDEDGVDEWIEIRASELDVLVVSGGDLRT